MESIVLRSFSKSNCRFRVKFRLGSGVYLGTSFCIQDMVSKSFFQDVRVVYHWRSLLETDFKAKPSFFQIVKCFFDF